MKFLILMEDAKVAQNTPGLTVELDNAKILVMSVRIKSLVLMEIAHSVALLLLHHGNQTQDNTPYALLKTVDLMRSLRSLDNAKLANCHQDLMQHKEYAKQFELIVVQESQSHKVEFNASLVKIIQEHRTTTNTVLLITVSATSISLSKVNVLHALQDKSQILHNRTEVAETAELFAIVIEKSIQLMD